MPTRPPSTRFGQVVFRSRAQLHAGLCVINASVNAKDRQTERLKLREALTAEIIADEEHEIGDVLTRALDGATDEDSEGIRDQVIAQTRFVTDALTTEKLQKKKEDARQL
jgi:hypothetical protein